MRTCPYCQVQIATAEKRCPTCGTPHHVECWAENEGCAVPLCESGPKLPYLGPRIATPPAAAAAPLPEPGMRLTVELDDDEVAAPAATVQRRAASSPARIPPRGSAATSRGRAWIIASVVLGVAVVGVLMFSRSRSTQDNNQGPGQVPTPVGVKAKLAARNETSRLINATVKHADDVSSADAAAQNAWVTGQSPARSSAGSAAGDPQASGGLAGGSPNNAAQQQDAGGGDSTDTSTTTTPADGSGQQAPVGGGSSGSTPSDLTR